MKKIFNLLLLACFVSTAAIHADDDIGSFSIGADWLYWKVEQQRMAIGGRAEAVGVNQVKVKVLKPDFEYNNGFKVFAGYTTQDQIWNTSLTLAHIPSNASVKASSNTANGDIFSFQGTNFDFSSGGSDIDMRWNASINYLDLDVERRLVFCDDLEIVPHIGIRGQWISQKVKFNSLTSTINGVRFNNTLHGVGLEGGCWGSWNLPFGVSLVGHFGGSLVYSTVRNTTKFPADGSLSELEISSPGYVSNAWIDSFVGIAYSRSFDCFSVNFHAGWEHHLIMNANHFSIRSGGDGDMTMQGLTLGASVDF